MCRIAKTAVAELQVKNCGSCPFHTTKYKRVHKGNLVFRTEYDFTLCTKTNTRVYFTTISPTCPLPHSPVNSDAPSAPSSLNHSVSSSSPEAHHG